MHDTCQDAPRRPLPSSLGYTVVRLIPPGLPHRASGRQPVQGIEAARAATAHYDDPDVVIVGAGASGAAVAWSLASAGFKVVVPGAGRLGQPPDPPPLPG